MQAYWSIENNTGQFLGLTNPNLRILNLQLQRNVSALNGNINLSLILDNEFKNINTRQNVLKLLKINSEIKIYQYSDNLFTKNKILLLDGVVKEYDIESPSGVLSVNIQDKTSDLQYRYVKPNFSSQTRNFKAHVNEFFRQQDLLNGTNFALADGIIYPTKILSTIKQENIMSTKDNSYCADYLNTLINDQRLKLTTMCLDNKSYLYFIDTGEILTKKTPAFTLFNGFGYTENTVTNMNVSIDGTKLYENFDISTKSNISKNNNAKKRQYSNFSSQFITRNTIPPLLYSNRIKSNVDGFNIQDYAKFLYKEQIKSAINIDVTVANLYINTTKLNRTFNLYQKVNIPKEINGFPNLIYYDLEVDFKSYLENPFESFVVAGFTMDYARQITTLNILPSSLI